MKTTRSRAWRRACRSRYIAKRGLAARDKKCEYGYYAKQRPNPKYRIPCYGVKGWKMLYGRAQKLHRAQKLGFIYPRRFEQFDEYSIRL